MCGNLNTMTCPDIRVSCLVNKLVWFGFVLFFILSFVDMYIYFLLARNQSVPLPPCLQAAYVHSDHVCGPITACWGGCFAKCWDWNTETRPCSLMCCLNGIRISQWLRVGRGQKSIGGGIVWLPSVLDRSLPGRVFLSAHSEGELHKQISALKVKTKTRPKLRYFTQDPENHLLWKQGQSRG